MRRSAPWLFVAAVAALVFFEARRGGTLQEGSDPPSLVTTLADGQRFDLRDHRGSVVVINFWATWCPPCRAEIPELSKTQDLLISTGQGTVLGVSTDDGSLPQIQRAARNLGANYPIALGSQAMLEEFRVRSLPTTYVIGPQGRILRAIVGGVTAAELESIVASAM